MDFAALFQLASPIIISLLGNMQSSLHTPAQPPPDATIPIPNAAIKDLQALLNTVLALNPPLAVDGWLGPKTNDAIEAGIAKLKGMGIG